MKSFCSVIDSPGVYTRKEFSPKLAVNFGLFRSRFILIFVSIVKFQASFRFELLPLSTIRIKLKTM